MIAFSPVNAESWTAKRIVGLTLVGAAIVVALLVGVAFQHVLVCLLLGLVIDAALSPLVNLLSKSRIPRWTSVALVYGTVTALVCLGIVFAAPTLLAQAGALGEKLPDAYRQVREQLLGIPVSAVHRLVELSPSELPVASNGNLATSSALADALKERPWGDVVLRGMLWTGAVLLLAFQWSLQKDRTIGSSLLFIADSKRDAARELVATLQDRVGAFVRGQLILCAAVGGLSLVAYVLIGLPNALALAALAGLLELIPYIGPILSTAPALMVAIMVDPSLVVWVLLAAIAIQLLENNLFVPKIMDNAVGVHPVGTLLALVAFTDLFGGVGMFLAIPLAAMLQVLFERYVLLQQDSEPLPPMGRDQASRVLYEARELIQDVRLQLRKKEDAPTNSADHVEDSIESIASELETQLSAIDAQRTARAFTLSHVARGE